MIGRVFALLTTALRAATALVKIATMDLFKFCFVLRRSFLLLSASFVATKTEHAGTNLLNTKDGDGTQVIVVLDYDPVGLSSYKIFPKR